MKAKKLLIALLAAVMLIAAFGPTTALADTYFTWHDYGWYGRYYLNGHIELIYYYGNDRNVTVPDRIGAIPVTGFVKNYTGNMDSTDTIIRKQTARKITFKLQITEIPTFFANDCPDLESVILPDSLLVIGEGAFMSCPKLSEINFPEGLKTIGPFAFKECSALQSIELPSTLKTISDSAFSTTGLRSVELPASLRTLDDLAFAKCEQLQTVTMKEGLQRIGHEAFSGCNALTSVDVPDSVLYLGEGAFRNCTQMTEAVLPKGLQAIPANLFYSCINLETVAIPSSVRIIHAHAFRRCADLESVTLPAGLTTLEDYAFSHSGLKSVHIPGGVTNIGAYAFYRSGGLKLVTMDYGVLTIGESIYNTDTANNDGFAFNGCASGLNLTLPGSVYKVYPNAFTEAADTRYYYDGDKQHLDRVDFVRPEDKTPVICRSTVSFLSEHGETPETLYPYKGEQIILPSLSVVTHHFQGWDLDGTTYDGGEKYTVQNDYVTFTAKWFGRVEIVTFITEKGATPGAQYLGYSEKAVEPAGQKVGDEYLAGWYRSPDFTGEPYDFNEPVTEDLKLYAKWTTAPQIDVNLTGGGGDNKVVFRNKIDSRVIYAELTESGSVRVPPDAEMLITAGDGMEYGGSIVTEVPLNDDMTEVRTFSIENGTSLYAPNYGAHSTVNIQFTAVPRVVANAVADDGLNADALWTLTDGYEPPHTLTDGSFVTVSEDGIADTRNDLTLTLSVPEGYGCDGTIFNGNESITVSEGITSYHITPLGVVTLNLHFYNKTNYVALTFRRGRTDGKYFTQKYPKGENAPDSFTAPDCPYTYSTAVFNHWHSEAGDPGAGDTAALPQTDTVYTAVWDAARPLYFRPNGGSGDMEKMVILEKDGYTTVVPECAYTQIGYAFIGWNTKANGSGTGYQPGDPITLTGTTYLYAQWKEAYNVKLYANYQGSGVNHVVQRVARGDSAALETPFTREGCLLTGWNTRSGGDGTAYAVGATVTPTADLNLYAQWHAHDYQFDSFIWSADSTAAQVRLVCAGDDTHVVCVDAEMAAFAREATCVADACTVYEAIYGDHNDTRTVTQAGSALGHDYGEPVWKWTIQNVGTEEDVVLEVSAVMEMFCERCGEPCTWDATVESETTAEPTATQPGETTYTATVVIEGTAYTCGYTMEIPALGLPANEAVEALIDAIGEVTYTDDCRAAINIARAVFNSLAEEEQAMVENYETLTAAEARYAELQAAAETPTDPTEPTEPENPDEPQAEDLCKWCGEPHIGFWGRFIKFFHSILFFFAHLFGKR